MKKIDGFSRTLGLFILLFVVSPMAWSNPGNQWNDKFLEANKSYEKGDYANALSHYMALVGQGYEGAALFYNIGNVFYRQGNRGPAILWYERALRLHPRDADIQFNLALAKSHLKEKKDSWIKQLVLYCTPKELGTIFSVIWWGFFIFLGLSTLGWLKGEVWPSLTLWTLGTLGIFIGVWMGANVVLSDQPMGIITKVPGEVRNGPGIEYAVGFTVPEGTEVIILNKRPDWTEVGIPQEGLKGWMPKDEVEAINWSFSSSN